MAQFRARRLEPSEDRGSSEWGWRQNGARRPRGIPIATRVFQRFARLSPSYAGAEVYGEFLKSRGGVARGVRAGREPYFFVRRICATNFNGGL
jgi:hypothetical protein